MRSHLWCLLILSLLIPASGIAQTPAQASPRFMMLNQHQCPPENMPQVRVVADSLLKPVLQELADEGAILGWGLLEHAWGDEWNWNFYVLTENHASFVDAWRQLGAKMNARRPDWFAEWFAPLCTAHKDNLYTVPAMR